MDNSKTTHTQILTIWIELIRMSTSGRHLPIKRKRKKRWGCCVPIQDQAIASYCDSGQPALDQAHKDW